MSPREIYFKDISNKDYTCRSDWRLDTRYVVSITCLASRITQHYMLDKDTVAKGSMTIFYPYPDDKTQEEVDPINAVHSHRTISQPSIVWSYSHNHIHSSDIAQQFSLEDKFTLLVLFRRFVSLIVFPTHRLLALATSNIPHDVPTSRHVPLCRVALHDIDHGIEKVRFAMLATKALRNPSAPSFITDK